MEAIVDLIANYGMTAVLMAYFLIKDYKTTGQIINTLQEIKEVLSLIRGGGDNGNT